jgi:hypothetical protein
MDGPRRTTGSSPSTPTQGPFFRRSAVPDSAMDNPVYFDPDRNMLYYFSWEGASNEPHKVYIPIEKPVVQGNTDA